MGFGGLELPFSAILLLAFEKTEPGLFTWVLFDLGLEGKTAVSTFVEFSHEQLVFGTDLRVLIQLLVSGRGFHLEYFFLLQVDPFAPSIRCRLHSVNLRCEGVNPALVFFLQHFGELFLLGGHTALFNEAFLHFDPRVERGAGYHL